MTNENQQEIVSDKGIILDKEKEKACLKIRRINFWLHPLLTLIILWSIELLILRFLQIIQIPYHLENLIINLNWTINLIFILIRIFLVPIKANEYKKQWLLEESCYQRIISIWWFTILVFLLPIWTCTFITQS